MSELQDFQLQIDSSIQLSWFPDLYSYLAIIIGVIGLSWLLYIMTRHRSDVTQLIEGRAKQIYIVIISIYSMLGIYYVFFGQLNYDEGTEIYVSNLVYSEMLPYVDFMYTHGPVLPYIYGVPQLIFGSSMYVGRFTSLFFGVLTLILTAKTAERLAGKTGAIIALALLTFNLYSLYLLTYAKSYELTAFFMILSLFFLFRNKDIGKRRDYMLSVLSMSLAAGVRLSLVPMVILLIIYIIYIERKNMKLVLQSAGMGIGTLAVLFIPFLIINRDVTTFNLYSYYVGGNPYITHYDKVSNFLFLIDKYFVISALFFVGAVILLYRHTHSTHIKFLYIAVSLVYAMHLIPTENLPEHPVILVPLVTVLAGFGFNELYNKFSNSLIRYAMLVTILIAILFTFVSAGPQWIDMSGNKLPIEEVDEMAKHIKNNTPRNGKIIAFSTYAAVQADRELLPGFSQAYYTYRPDWSDDKALEYNVINMNLLNQYIESRSASAILLTDFERRVIGNEPARLIQENYDLVKTMGAWGQHVNTAYLYLPKDIVISVEKLRIGYDDTQTWTATLSPNTDYLLTLRSPTSPVVIVLGSGNADADGNASGSFVVARNLPSGIAALRVELISDSSMFEEVIFIVGDPPASITLTLEKSQIVFDDTQTWTAKGFLPYESYVLMVRSSTSPVVIVLGSGNADADGNASGSFVVARNLPSGENILRIEVASHPAYGNQTTFRIG